MDTAGAEVEVHPVDGGDEAGGEDEGEPEVDAEGSEEGAPLDAVRLRLGEEEGHAAGVPVGAQVDVLLLGHLEPPRADGQLDLPLDEHLDHPPRRLVLPPRHSPLVPPPRHRHRPPEVQDPRELQEYPVLDPVDVPN